MSMLLGDMLLVFCLAAWVTEMVIADCEPAQLTGCLLGSNLPTCRVPSTEPASVVNPFRGEVLI